MRRIIHMQKRVARLRCRAGSRRGCPTAVYGVRAAAPRVVALEDSGYAQERDPAAVCISALKGSGVDELVETIASRLALDVRRITIVFDPLEPGARERIARLYRHARVLAHETRDGRATIVADVPRRVLSRLDLPKR